MDRLKIENAVRDILDAIGEDKNREGLKETPRRVADMLEEIFGGLDRDPKGFIKVFDNGGEDGLITVRNIPLYSMCEHHLLPFIGVAHIAYIPKNGRIIGLSKLARIVDCYARRPQVQERLTKQIKDCIQNTLNPLGVAVVIEAQHMCMSMRGVQKQNSVTTTSDFTGAFMKDPKTREEFMHIIGVDLH